jgi:hypothetical protein
MSEFSETRVVSLEQQYKKIYSREKARINRMIANTRGYLSAATESNREIYDRQLKRLQETKSFLRRPYRKDLEFRRDLMKEMPKRIKEILPEDSQLRFHATALSTVRHILDEGVVSSAADHDGVRRSMDIKGMISVTDRNSVEVSIRDYLNLENKSLPIGCMFVLVAQPRETRSSSVTMTMKNVKLKDSGSKGERFCCILCSPEVRPKVREWLDRFEYPKDLAVDYFQFGNYLQENFPSYLD